MEIGTIQIGLVLVDLRSSTKAEEPAPKSILSMSQFDSAQSFEVDAWKQFKSGKFDEAIKLFNQAIISKGTLIADAVSLFVGRR